MAKFYLISYDLRSPGQNYTELYDEIKKLGEWQHLLESVWLVKVDSGITSKDIYDEIRPKMNDVDRIFIVEVSSERDYTGRLPKSFWSWFKQL